MQDILNNEVIIEVKDALKRLNELWPLDIPDEYYERALTELQERLAVEGIPSTCDP